MPARAERQTPIEVALGVDAEGMTTAKNLYAFLELHPAAYSRWLKKNIKENIFAELNQDYFPLNTNVEREISAFEAKQQNTDYKLTASFAKKLAMSSQTPGELAREYFIRVEQNAIQILLIYKDRVISPSTNSVHFRSMGHKWIPPPRKHQVCHPETK